MRTAEVWFGSSCTVLVHQPSQMCFVQLLKHKNTHAHAELPHLRSVNARLIKSCTLLLAVLYSRPCGHGFQQKFHHVVLATHSQSVET